MTDTTPMRERLIQAAHKSLGHKQEYRHCTKAYQTEITGIVDAILAELETPNKDTIFAGVLALPLVVTQFAAPVFVAMVKAIRGGA